jgi:hypothetical protein
MDLILLAWAIPAVYSLANMFFIGQMEMEAVAISEQHEYVGVLLEVLLEMFPVAVLALVAYDFSKNKRDSRNMRTAVIMQLAITLSFMLFILLGAELLVNVVNTPLEIQSCTSEFLRVQALAIPFESLGVLFIISIKAKAVEYDLDEATDGLPVPIAHPTRNASGRGQSLCNARLRPNTFSSLSMAYPLTTRARAASYHC